MATCPERQKQTFVSLHRRAEKNTFSGKRTWPLPATLRWGVCPTHRHRSVLVFNLHRLYGPQRLQHLTANWRVVEVHPPWDRFTNYTHLQPTWVLRKVAGL